MDDHCFEVYFKIVSFLLIIDLTSVTLMVWNAMTSQMLSSRLMAASIFLVIKSNVPYAMIIFYRSILPSKMMRLNAKLESYNRYLSLHRRSCSMKSSLRVWIFEMSLQI
jgi:recombinational DNA repair protein RecT